MVRFRATRRWLWRLNGALLVGALATWGAWLGDRSGETARSWRYGGIRELPLAEAPTRTGPVAWDELVHEFRGWWPCDLGEVCKREVTEPVVVGPATRPPLGAFRVTGWWRDPGGPDAVVLTSKDPAHPETYVVLEGRPDRDVSIVGIEERRREGHITLARGPETFTFVVPLDRPVDRRVRGVGGSGVLRTSAASEVANGSDVATGGGAPSDVRLVPFYGEEGSVAGVRVTGVRAESRWAKLGLRAGDVIERVGDDAAVDVPRALAVLGSDAVGPISVQRGIRSAPRRVTISR